MGRCAIQLTGWPCAAWEVHRQAPQDVASGVQAFDLAESEGERELHFDAVTAL